MPYNTRFSQQALRDLDKIMEQSVNDNIDQYSPIHSEQRTEDHSYARLNTAATCVKTRGKAAATHIKRLRSERNVNITTHRKEKNSHHCCSTWSSPICFLHFNEKSGPRRSRRERMCGSPLPVESNSVKMVRQLVECGANVNNPTSGSNTPMHLVMNSNNGEMCK